MDADIIKRMRQEEADLERKLKAVRDVLSAYGEAPQRVEAPTIIPVKQVAIGSREKVEITSFTEQTRRSVVLAMQALAKNPNLMKTRELVEFVEAAGHEISGQNKVNALGALLARSADIVGHGKSGWTLANRDNALALIGRYAPKAASPVNIDDLMGSDAPKEFEPHSVSAGGSETALHAQQKGAPAW